MALRLRTIALIAFDLSRIYDVEVTFSVQTDAYFIRMGQRFETKPDTCLEANVGAENDESFRTSLVVIMKATKNT